MTSLADRIDALLPQTQCAKCGYPACRPYAEALARGDADINRCPPGGAEGVRRLAALLDRPYRPLDPGCGAEGPRRVAVIDEERCIGCTLCIRACPVDAIVGAAKLMHTVVAALCSGCDLCAAPCPVDCIAMVPATGDGAAWGRDRADAARGRFQARGRRLERAERLARRALGASAPGAREKRAVIEAAIERARARRRA